MVTKKIYNMELLKNTVVMVALTYDCQCSCVHCGSDSLRQLSKEKLTKNEIFHLIDETSRLGADWIYFFGGEPLLDNNLFDYMKYSKNKNFKIRLDTNGYLLNEDMIKKLKAFGIDLIRVSIDSPHEEIHDKLRGVKGIFKKATNGILLCKKYDIPCFLSTYATKESLKNGDLQLSIDLAKDLGAKVRILSPICSGKWKDKKDLIFSDNEIRSLKKFLKKDAVFWEKIDSEDSPFLCHCFTKDLLYITAYGDVQPCCYWPKNYGNIREEKLENIINRMRSSIKTLEPAQYDDCPINSLDMI